ncbi:hypothetical protein RV11_GL002442 [Enterococcus phoeniculicola]|jgi:purine catabolism regulator|uniref:PucR family transcriptional regulator n=1 Tax=Enterococcus phoeniculicola ATCC BAA-412 TaxID=1158610 RepID=R3TU36_9ENTE|nr:PucR family transcriptional regulator [Enterococcus phoeniculicola]EOL44693.1 hypothetical protein UC3_01510 [Enterococcus phoeniculicola ATCC BAA-412]EOT74982.1 hypothetical protein I589_02582 [Enterococcus phoeniculicola ATCC BAA-412]OJG72868.1 hypothetical protein RV11_GL002442 [Enterococcus phoeniculicola]
MNVADFLSLPSSQEFRLIAGENGLNRTITSVNIMDNPHADDWLFAGELLVTSGYFFGMDKQQQAKYFKRFQELSIAAVCIKPHIFFEVIPEHLLALCNEFQIPLIEIPYGVAFSKILKTVMNQLSASVDSEKQFALDVHSQFFETALNGGGIDYLAKELSRIIENPVLITSGNWQALTLEGFDEALKNTLIYQENDFIFPKQALENLPMNVEKLKHPIYRNLVFQDQPILCCILPIFFNQTNYGYIIVYLTQRPLSNIDYIVLESCTMSIALEIVHQTEKERVNNRIHRDFFTHLLSGNELDLEALNSFTIEINESLNYSAFIVQTNFLNEEELSFVETRKKEEQLMQLLLSASHKYIKNNFLDTHIFKQGNLLIGLLGTEKNLSFEEVTIRQRKQLMNLQAYLEAQSANQVQLSIVVGSTQSLFSVHKSYSEATNMLTIIQPAQTGIFFLNDFYLETFLSKQIPEKEADLFTSHFLHKLIDYDEKNGSDLLETLEVYLDNHLNIASTSRELYIHRNTLLYRIERMKDILGMDITDKKHTFALQLALKFHQK